MYEEKHEGLSVKAVILQILIVILFVFLLMWIFPLKNVGNNNSNDKGTLVITERVFNENVTSMKEAAKDYFTKARLPKNIGDKVTITLGEMLQKKIILGFADKDGKQCDNTASYVEITKLDDEYEMKINLKCSSQEDYLIVKIGCYDYCENDVCENETEEITKYQYKCPVIGGWTAWSNWQKTVVTSTSTRQVETKVVKETVTTQENQTYTVTKQVEDGVKQVPTGQYTTSTRIQTFVNYSPSGASCTSELREKCNECYKYELVYTCIFTDKKPIMKTVTNYKNITTTETKVVDVNKTIDVTYYRYRTYTKNSYYYKWSLSKNDSSLIKKSCKLTGKTSTTTQTVSK